MRHGAHAHTHTHTYWCRHTHTHTHTGAGTHTHTSEADFLYAKNSPLNRTENTRLRWRTVCATPSPPAAKNGAPPAPTAPPGAPQQRDPGSELIVFSEIAKICRFTGTQTGLLYEVSQPLGTRRYGHVTLEQAGCVVLCNDNTHTIHTRTRTRTHKPAHTPDD